MPPITSDALVLRTYKLGETSKVVVLLTRERGKVRAVAKGARGRRSRYQSALEPLSEVRVGLYGRQGAELYRLGECELLRSAFPAGARGLEEAMSLSYFAELLDAFAQEGEAEDTVYRLAQAVVGAVGEGSSVTAGAPATPPTLQEVLFILQRFWAERGCIVQQPWDAEVGAGTMHPETFLRVLGPKPWRVAYVQPSRRPADGRYGENPNRLYKHYQFQVVLKPAPADVQDVYLQSLVALGIDPAAHDVRFEEDNWESPTLGAWGIGWQVLVDGLEITQFTYFQQAGGIDLWPISAEITYGLERIAAMIDSRESVYDINWSMGKNYASVRLADEQQFSRYSFEIADVEMHWKLLSLYEAEAARLIEQELLLPAYDYCLKCSHAFNVLEARGAISVTERVGVIARIRKLVCQVAENYSPQSSRST